MNYLNPFDLINSYNLFKKIRKEMFEIVSNSENSYPSSVKAMHAIDGSIKFLDAYALKKLLEEHEPASILEVGSFLGFSTRWLLESSDKWTAKVTSIDPNIRHRIYDNPRGILKTLNKNFYPGRLEVVTGFFGSSGDFAYYCYEHYEPLKTREEVDLILETIPVIDSSHASKYDFIFIDGDHSYESAMKDFKLANELLNPEGCIAFHDVLEWPGVYRSIMEISQKYHQSADVKIYGSVFHRMFNAMNKARIFPRLVNDGIGVFILKK